MRDDDDNIWLYGPLLRRIIILVAVIVAVPVVLWTITAFMRTYVAQPKVPTFRPIAAATLTTAPDGTAAAMTTTGSVNAMQASPPIVVAKATTTDAGNFGLGQPGPVTSNQVNSDTANASAAAGANVASASPPTSAASVAAVSMQATTATPAAMPYAPTNAVPAADQPQTAADDQSADALPTVAPLTGPIPLPHPRPRSLALAANGVPMPRARPTATAGSESGPASTPGALDWLGNIFRGQSQGQGQQ